MSAPRHGQELGGTCPPPLEMLSKCFCTLVVTAKRLVDELIIYALFSQPSSASGDIPGPRLRPLICPLLEKILRAPMTTAA